MGKITSLSLSQYFIDCSCIVYDNNDLNFLNMFELLLMNHTIEMYGRHFRLTSTVHQCLLAS
jgi:hypothetical protein